MDDQNTIIGETTITEAKQNNWPRRVTRVCIFNEKKEMLMQKRSDTAHLHPGLWDCSGGHVDLGESYIEAGEREVKEELGVEVTLHEVSKAVHFDTTFYVLCTGFLPSTQACTLQADEVAVVRWVSTEEVTQLIAMHPESFTPWMVHIWENYQKQLTDAV